MCVTCKKTRPITKFELYEDCKGRQRKTQHERRRVSCEDCCKNGGTEKQKLKAAERKKYLASMVDDRNYGLVSTWNIYSR